MPLRAISAADIADIADGCSLEVFGLGLDSLNSGWNPHY